MKKLISLVILVWVVYTTHAQVYNKDFFFMRHYYGAKNDFHGTKVDFGSYPYKLDTNVLFFSLYAYQPRAKHSAYTPQTVLSDSVGNVRFNADNYRVWNKNHTILYNHHDSGEFYYNECAGRGLLAPVPQNDSLVYYFSFSGGCYYNWWGIGIPYALQMFTINQKLDSGKGGCIEKYKVFNTNIIPTGVLMKHRNGRDYWLVVKKFNTIDYLSYLITPNGIDTINYIYSSVSKFSLNPNIYTYGGQMKSSVDGKTIALSIRTTGNTEILDFNDSTGELTNPRMIAKEGGIELSPNGKKLYLSINDTLSVYDVTQQTDSAVALSKVIHHIQDNKVYRGIQLMPDCRILLLTANEHSGVINYPNEDSANIGYDSMGFFRNSKLWDYDGLGIAHPPAWSLIPKGMKRNSLKEAATVCEGDTTTLQLKTCSPGKYRWEFGDGDTALTKDSGVVYKHIYTQGGTYTATVYIKNPCGIDTVSAAITVIPKPTLNIGNDTTICDRGQTITLKGNLTGYKYKWNTGDSTQTISTTKKGLYHAKATNGVCTVYDTLSIIRQQPPILQLYSNYYKCPDDTVTIDAKNPKASILWSNGDTAHTTQIKQVGSYTVQVKEGVCTTTGNFAVTDYIVKKPKVIKMAADSIIIPNQYIRYQWSMNGSALGTDTNNYLKLLKAGTYFCMATSQNGCKTTSDTVGMNVGLFGNAVDKNGMNIYPNPTKGLFTVELKQTTKGTVYIYDLAGKRVYEKLIAERLMTIDISHLPVATYLLKVVDENGVHEISVVKQ